MKKIVNIVMFVFLTASICPADMFALDKLPPERAAEVRRIIVAWLECEECKEGQLEAVVKLGRIAVPSLAAGLHKGPSQASEELYRQHLIATYRDLKKYEKTHPEAATKMTEKDYVKTYMENYFALYQARAATALAAIGGPDAKAALQKAFELPLRKDVRAVVKESLAKIE